VDTINKKSFGLAAGVSLCPLLFVVNLGFLHFVSPALPLALFGFYLPLIELAVTLSSAFMLLIVAKQYKSFAIGMIVGAALSVVLYLILFLLFLSSLSIADIKPRG